MQRSRTVLVTGGTGFIGSHLIEKLVSLGYRVRLLLRRLAPKATYPRQVELLYGDLCDNTTLKKSVQGVDVVFHLAAKLHLNDPTPASHKDYEQTNVSAARRLAAIAYGANVSRFIFYSTINVYGCTENDQAFDEESSLNPQSWYAQTKADAEKLVLDEAPAVVLRLAAVYGTGMKGNYLRLLNALRTGRFVMIGSGLNRRTLVHVNDVSDASLLTANHPDAAGKVYNVTDGQVHTLRDIVAAMCTAQGRAIPRWRLPAEPIRPALGFCEDVFRHFGADFPFGRSIVDKFTEDLSVRGDKIQRELRFKPRYNLLAGWQECIAPKSGGTSR